jgi:digeranylgeranylglycerophospholipid reductase
LTQPSDVIVAGAGPAGLAAAENIARRGCSVTVLEQNHEIGAPIRTSGGSFIAELRSLGIPEGLWHPISRLRFVSAHNAAVFDYPDPAMCVVDVRGVFQHLAERAIAAGASIRLATTAVAPIVAGSRVTGVIARCAHAGRDEPLDCRILIDATGYRSTLLKQVGPKSAGTGRSNMDTGRFSIGHATMDPGFRRFGVGAEYDLYAPHCDQREAVLVVGEEAAPSGYAWVFPWGRNRVRVGVGIIHPDSTAKPGDYLDRFVARLGHYGVDARGAQPLEYHAGLIPSERFARTFAGDGIIGVGDAVGQASSLLGEGIRWAIRAGQMAGDTAAAAIESGDTSRQALLPFEQSWRKQFGMNLRLAHRINQRIARWDGPKWDARVELLKKLSPAEFAEALKTNLTGRWLWKLAASGALFSRSKLAADERR